MSRTFDVAVVGTSGLVGEAVLELLAESRLPVGRLYPVDEEDGAGERVEFRGSHLRVEALDGFDFTKVQLALFCADAEVAAKYAAKAAATGCVVIDGSGQFSDEPEIPLVVAEVNPDALAGWRGHGIVAAADSATVQLALALKPLQAAAGLERLSVVSCEAVSADGRAGVEELARQSASLLSGRPAEGGRYPRQIAFNLLPQVGELEADGRTHGEARLVRELRRVLAQPALEVAVTRLRVSVFHGYAQAVHISTRIPLGAAGARDLLAEAPGVLVLDKGKPGGYPTPATEAAIQDEVYVGRIRADDARPRELELWIVADDVRRGAALNCIRIAERLVETYL
ncbi:MAG TPA: aspartate-semialdehyde dehydrogenase [Candidatus Competibacteraceae bacterium]|nr:aspartate-semialdehyde dehydrogenase [Candidatus Competibacteraceae bacterium]